MARQSARDKKNTEDKSQEDEIHEIAVVGDLTDSESEITDKLLAVPEGGACTLYFDCPGGGAYSAIHLLSLIAIRRLDATGIVTGECSSAAIWPLAACRRRLVSPFSILLFHPLKWQSEENIGLAEAREWARHFGQLEEEMDRLLASFLNYPYEQLVQWMQPGRYVTGREFVQAGLGELIQLAPVAKGRK
jgi:ATP-dependent Clp protease protease subunit